MSYKNVSKNEAELLNRIEDTGLKVFGTSELRRLMEWKNTKINNVLQSLMKKGIIDKIKKNNYVLSEDLKEKAYEVATELVNPSYLSHWSALSYYGFTDQQVGTVQLVTTKQTKDINHPLIRIEATTLNRERFYGYSKNGFSIAEKEKALVDSLYMLDKVGGLDEFTKCLENAWNELDENRFVRYLIRFNNRSMVSRAGYLIDKLDLPFDSWSELRKNTSRSYIKLVSGKPKRKNYSSKWNVIVNDEVSVE